LYAQDQQLITPPAHRAHAIGQYDDHKDRTAGEYGTIKGQYAAFYLLRVCKDQTGTSLQRRLKERKSNLNSRLITQANKQTDSQLPLK